MINGSGMNFSLFSGVHPEDLLGTSGFFYVDNKAVISARFWSK